MARNSSVAIQVNSGELPFYDATMHGFTSAFAERSGKLCTAAFLVCWKSLVTLHDNE